MNVIVLFLSFFIGNGLAMAQEAVPEVGEVEESTLNRADKKFTATYQFTGLGPNLAVGGAINLGYFLKPNMVLSIEGTKGSEATWDLFDDTEVDARSIGIHLKHYVGNSFYYRVGVDHRTMEHRYTDFFITSTTRTFDAKSLGVTVNIGNQWQWEHFTLGCDWVGVTLPVSKSYSNESVVTTGDAVYHQGQLEEDKKDYMESPILNLLRFYIGASF